VQGEITYFEENRERMRYDLYRAMKLPIGSGTVESSCKNVIGARMKQGGMTWSESGAEGMLQIRTSLASQRFLQDFRHTLRRAA
ncbi:MAG: ISKra4 family transposase, partial [Spirochaetales bacterium]|nr:ISKra4 family transposase [Spirochaetales bacterium]